MEDIPPCSRLYISLGSGFNPTNLRELLESYGRVEEFKAPRKTNAKGEVRQRGFAFVKFFKTSDAAAALEGLDGTEFENLTLKVSVAGNITNIIPRLISFTLPEAQELDQVEEMLSRFGTVKEVYFYNKTNTRVNARFDKFSEAANCVEQLGEYSAYLVVPKHKPERECGVKRAFEDVNYYENYNTDINAVGSEHLMMMYQNPSMYQNPMMTNLNHSSRTNGNHISDALAPHSVRTNLRVVYNPVLSVEQVSRIFDIIPGFLSLQLQEVGSNGALGLVSYSSTEYAYHALTKLQGLEYPLKSFFQLELISPDKTSISDPIPDLEPEPELAPAPEPAQVYDVGSAVDAGLVCSVDLPPPEPLVDPNSEVVTSIFFVIKQLAGSPTQQLVDNLFSRFGNLVQARCMRGKSCGFAKFSNDESAQKCLNTLKDGSLLGCALRVEIVDPSRFGEKTFRR